MNEDHYALVDGTSTVVNVIVWNGVQPYQPAEGVTLVPLPFVEETDEETGETVGRYQGGIGWDYVDGQFVDNRPVEDFE
jgi:hypothetical protein